MRPFIYFFQRNLALRPLWGVVLFLGMTGTTTKHPDHHSLCNLNYNPRTQHIEMVQRIFIDDLLDEFSVADSLSTQALKNTELDSFFERNMPNYFQKHLILWINDKEIAMNYVGQQIKGPQLVVYLESQALLKEVPQKITLKSTILHQMFEDQKNLVKIKILDWEYSFLLTPTHTQESTEVKP